MKKFIKDGLETLVEDNDRRIPDYLKNGWKEAEVTLKATDEADKQTQRAIDDVETSEGKSKGSKGSKGGKGSKGSKAPGKKVNDAIAANAAAAAENVAVDDGLIKTEGN